MNERKRRRKFIASFHISPFQLEFEFRLQVHLEFLSLQSSPSQCWMRGEELCCSEEKLIERLCKLLFSLCRLCFVGFDERSGFGRKSLFFSHCGWGDFSSLTSHYKTSSHETDELANREKSFALELETIKTNETTALTKAGKRHFLNNLQDCVRCEVEWGWSTMNNACSKACDKRGHDTIW